jgi:hypothetical protein
LSITFRINFYLLLIRYKIDHKRIYLNALRTAIIFSAGLIVYELLIKLENLWNSEFPKHKTYNFQKRIIYKFAIIYILDVIVLYFLYLYFNVNL